MRNQKYNNTGPQTSRECFKIEELRYRSDYISIVCDRWRPEQVWFLQWTWYYTYVECVALFSLCPDVYARLFKISGVSGRKKIRVERISPYFLGKKIEMFRKEKASLSEFEQMEVKFLKMAIHFVALLSLGWGQIFF